ncbi:MAG: amidase [Roseiflexaceae bacterium]
MEQQFTRCGATELAGLIARGEVSSLEVVEAHIARIEQVNPQLNAVVVKRYDQARDEARRADERRAGGATLGPLHGVPVTIKECLDVVGTPSSFGLRRRANDLPLRDDPYVARLRAAGAIVVGKTNVPQLLLYYESDNPLYGRTSNPWDLARTSGGSSGGESAIIAAGGSPLGLGNDIGGSVRVPAAFCGIASIKPTAPRTLDFSRYADNLGPGLVVPLAGPMAREVADVALGLELMSEVPNALCPAPPPIPDYRTVDLRGLRVAYYTDDGTFSPSPALRRAVRETAELLRSAGALVSEWRPPDAPAAMVLYLRLLGYVTDQIPALMRGERLMPQLATLMALSRLPRPTLAALERVMRRAGQHGMAGSLGAFGYNRPVDRRRADAACEEYRRRFAQELDRGPDGPFDLIICPPCGLPALTHGASAQVLTAGAYAPLYNLLGYPAGVVPVTQVRPGEEIGRAASLDLVQRTARQVELGSAGLPIGVQIVGRPWQEHLVLAAMHAVEEAVRVALPALPAATLA